jgi:hypothetical protein
MDLSCKTLVNELVRVSVDKPELQEVAITEEVAHRLKRKKTGMFQNEVDYRILFPRFTPPEDIPAKAQRLRADLAGFAAGKLILTEFKLYNENIRTSNHWKVLFYLLRDRVKLESAIRANENGIPGFVIQACAVQNTDFTEHREQTSIMSNGFVQENGKAKSISNTRYFPILPAFANWTREISTFDWDFQIVRKATTAVLIGVATLSGGVANEC